MAGLDHCPTCGEPAERGQLVCLNCGGRIALDYRRPYGWRPAAAIVLAVVAVGAGLSGWAIGELTSDSEKEVAVVESNEAAATEARQAETQSEPQPDNQPKPKPRPAGPQGWPDGVTANTVVLVSSSDKAGAQQVASEAAKTGLRAGLIQSDRYDLGEGLWIVYAGRFPTRDAAAAAASRLAPRYPGAYPQLIQSP